MQERDYRGLKNRGRGPQITLSPLINPLTRLFGDNKNRDLDLTLYPTRTQGKTQAAEYEYHFTFCLPIKVSVGRQKGLQISQINGIFEVMTIFACRQL